MESTLQAVTRPLGVLIHPCHKLLALCLSFLLPFFCKPTASLIAKASFREQAESQGGRDPIIPQNVSAASPFLLPAPRLADVTRHEVWIKDSGHSWGFN